MIDAWITTVHNTHISVKKVRGKVIGRSLAYQIDGQERPGFTHAEGTTWHRSREKAAKRVEELRSMVISRRRRHLRKVVAENKEVISRLKEMNIEIPE